MIGHHGLRLLMRLAEEALEENQRRRSAPPPGRAEGESPLQELRRLYAGGELDRDTFLEMRSLARRGQLTRADLEEARLQAKEMRALESPEAREASRSVASIRQHLRALEKAKSDSETTAKRLEGQIEYLRSQAARQEAEARRIVLEDESRARSVLELRESMLEQVDRLTRSVSELRQDIQRIDELQKQLSVQEQELEAGRARARLEALERGIRREEGP